MLLLLHPVVDPILQLPRTARRYHAEREQHDEQHHEDWQEDAHAP